MRREIVKNNKGITLIALVITIIILIILAGVSINIVFDEDGIIERAKQAAENMEIAQVEEQEMLNTALNYIENQGKVVIEGPIDGGSYDNPYIPTGFTHTEGEGTWNSGYVIREKDTGNEFVWVPCVTDQSKVKDGDKVVTFQKILPTTTDTTDLYYMYNRANFTIKEETGTTPSEIETSVGIYGGFYIARYEAGIEGTQENYDATTETGKTALDVKPLSQKGKGVWNYIERADAIAVSENMIDGETGAKSALITAACWDTTLQWMVKTSDNSTKNAGYDIDSTGNGWYEKENKTTTGQFAINNIYDMAGNVWEWTTENCSTNGTNTFCVRRGGAYTSVGVDKPAALRANSRDANQDVGFRVVLYK